MPRTVLFALAALATLCLASPAAAVGCRGWMALSPQAKQARIERTIEGHLTSNESKQWTNENRPAMRRCLRQFTPQIIEEMTDACTMEPRMSAAALDDIFDKYFLSCVQ